MSEAQDNSMSIEETAVGILGAIEKLREEGIKNEEEYERLMEKGLTNEQLEVAEKIEGEGRVFLEDKEIPRTIDNLLAQRKSPWMVKVNGVWFIVKTTIGAGGHPHSEWWWKEEGYRFTFYKARRDDCRDSLQVQEIDS